jgi:hypothetical protein
MQAQTPLVGAVLLLGALLNPSPAPGQGCAPARFSGALPGTEGDIYLRRHTWQVGLAYRQLSSNHLIQGHVDMGPSSVVKSQTLFTSLTYGLSDRAALTLSLPLSHGSHETAYPDGLRHVNTATGLGDVSLSASYWLFNANPLRPGGNLEMGFGVKVPTGKNDVEGTWWNADGSTIPWPVHQSIQLGDGGLGLIVRTQGFQPLFPQTYLYAGGAYTLNPRKTTDVVRTPGSSQHWAVPDTWDASAGLAWAVWPERGLSTRLGVEFEGTRKRDLIGGTDSLEHRLPATAGYIMPAFTLARGAHTLTMSVGARIYKNFLPSVRDDVTGSKGGGGLAKYVFQGGYVVRF